MTRQNTSKWLRSAVLMLMVICLVITSLSGAAIFIAGLVALWWNRWFAAILCLVIGAVILDLAADMYSSVLRFDENCS